jgi:hypothetical protein
LSKLSTGALAAAPLKGRVRAATLVTGDHVASGPSRGAHALSFAVELEDVLIGHEIRQR